MAAHPAAHRASDVPTCGHRLLKGAFCDHFDVISGEMDGLMDSLADCLVAEGLSRAKVN